MICDKGFDDPWRGPASCMLIASRNVNRRSIVNLYCSLEKERERERVRNGAILSLSGARL